MYTCRCARRFFQGVLGWGGGILEEGMWKHMTRNLFPLLFAPLTHWIGIGSCDPMRQYVSLKIQPYPREEGMWKHMTRNLFPLLFVPLTHWIVLDRMIQWGNMYHWIHIGSHNPLRRLNRHWIIWSNEAICIIEHTLVHIICFEVQILTVNRGKLHNLGCLSHHKTVHSVIGFMLTSNFWYFTS